MNINNTIIYLIGFAGTGKNTIANEIKNFRLVDNHLINNPIFSVINLPVKEEGVWRNIEKIRDVVLETIIDYSPQDFNFIFTNELIEGNDFDLSIFNKIKKVADKRKSTFIPIKLICSPNELEKRISNAERTKKLKQTIIDPNIKNQTVKLFTPNHPNTQVLDITHLTAQESATMIQDIVLKFINEQRK